MGSFKNLILKNYETRKAEFYIKAFWHRPKASWLKSWPPRVWWGKWKWNVYFDIWKMFLYGARLLRWAMWPMGLLFDKLFKLIPCLQKFHHSFPRNEIWSLYIEYLKIKRYSANTVSFCAAIQSKRNATYWCQSILHMDTILTIFIRMR
jgi:hypothetical protein